eukprot:TRINITY_DN15007_c0_g1_i2.p1 TRINITY_DN15007_c0_g1~~TRINITY_DN15007_c0_g1_i2.p1  ORF type:complete len:394 (+),score=56.93 TRINITY_DN15007_c0_g1_i2:66-1184(+)
MAAPAAHAARAGVGDAGEGAAGAQQEARGTERHLLESAAFALATAVHTLIGTFGFLCLLHTAQAGLTLHAQGVSVASLGWRGLVDAALLIFGNFIVPFSQSAASYVTRAQESVGFDALSVWMPCILGVFFLWTSALAQLSLRFRRLMFVAPYALSAVFMLVWQAEMMKMITKIAEEEVFEIKENAVNLDKSQAVQLYMLNASYAGFSSVYEEQRCAATLPTGNKWGFKPVQVECEGDSLEAQLMQMASSQFCRAHSGVPAFIDNYQSRVEMCLKQGGSLRVLPSRTRPRDTVFCRCRTAMFDILRVAMKWCLGCWFVELFAAVSVLYFGAEANLSKMDSQERYEIIGFAAVGTLALALKMTVFADPPLEDDL